MAFKHLLPCFFLAATALSACIRDEALNQEAAIDACTGADVQFTKSGDNWFNIYVSLRSDLAAQHLTFTVPDGATITAENAAEGEAFVKNDNDGTYSATLNFDNGSLSRRVTVTSEDRANHATYLIQIIQIKQLPTQYHFEGLLPTEQRYHILLECEDATSDTLQWSSGNPGFELTRQATTPEGYPTARENGGYGGGYCARLKTCDTGFLGGLVGMPLAAGNLFIGSFDVSNALGNALEATKFGVQFYREPVSLKGYYRYRRGEVYSESGTEVSGKQDTYNIYAMLYESENPSFMLNGGNGLTDPSIVLLAQVEEADAKEADNWTEFEIPFKPMNGKAFDPQKLGDGKYKLGIVFTSSRNGDRFNGAVGSTLWIDEVELVCK